MPRLAKKSTHMMIRFALRGCTNRPFYHIVVMENRSNRNAMPAEQLGTYDPMPNIHQEKLVAVNFERLSHWLACGAHCSKPVEKLLGLAGFFPIHPMSYITAQRNRKKLAQKEAEERAAEDAQEASASTAL